MVMLSCCYCIDEDFVSDEYYDVLSWSMLLKCVCAPEIVCVDTK